MPTVLACKANFQAMVAPGNDSEFLRILQEADCRLLEGSNNGWTRARVTLTPASGFVTLPPEYASILGAQLSSDPLPIDADTLEFLPYGEGDVPIGVGGSRLIDQGLNDSDQRTYKVAGHIASGETILCLCQKAPAVLYDPSMNESDVPDEAIDHTLCPSMEALKDASLAVVYGEAGDPGNAKIYLGEAFHTLNRREASRRGSAKPKVTFKPIGPGISRIRSFR